MMELRQNPSLLKSQQEYSQNLFIEKFDLTKQLKKILTPVTDSLSKHSFDALVLGNSESDLHGRLKKLGFSRIEHSNLAVLDLQDLLSLARSLDLKEFCVFYSNTEMLDGFNSTLSELGRLMKTQDSQFGVIPTVALSQGGQSFAPVIMGKTGAVPLNGLVVNLNLKNSTFAALSKIVPVLRVHDSFELPQISTFHDSYSFLLGIAKDPKRDSNVSIRHSVRSGFERNHLRNYHDLVEEIRVMPRTRRRMLGYSLLAALPFMRPLIALAKWFIRKKT
jgi:hypothetical protein